MILIVDDEEEIAKALKRYLAIEGYQCEWAPDGVAAIERLGRTPVPELVLLDYRMPGVNGIEVLRYLQSRPMTTAVPVVMVSGDLKRCPDGAQLLLEKPFEAPEFLAIVNQLANGTPSTREYS